MKSYVCSYCIRWISSWSPYCYGYNLGSLNSIIRLNELGRRWVFLFLCIHTLLLALVRLARRNLINITMWLKKVLMPNVGLESQIMLTTKVVLSFLHVLYCFKPMASVHVELCSYYVYLSSFIANKNYWCHQRLNIGWRLLFFSSLRPSDAYMRQQTSHPWFR